MDEIQSDHNGERPAEFPIVAFYDTDRVIFDRTEQWSNFKKEFTRYDAFEGALSDLTAATAAFEESTALKRRLPNATGEA